MLSRRHMLKLGFFGSGYKLVSAAGLIRPVRRSASLDKPFTTEALIQAIKSLVGLEETAH